MTLRSYVLSRLLQIIPTILAIIILTFIIIHALPGDPLIALAGESASEEYLINIRQKYGLDKPIYEQLINYLGHIFRGDLGFSFHYNEPVLNVILERIPATITLIGTAIIFSFFIGIVLGVTASRKPYSKTDNALMGIAVLFYSIPFFWLAQMLLITFTFHLRLFPVGGIGSFGQTWTSFSLDFIIDRVRHLMLPALTLSTWYFALIFRLTRASMLETLRQDYIVFARSKGLKERTIVYKHALRTAVFPVITVTGMFIGLAFAGVIYTETVFSWPGLGRLMFDAIYARDYPVLTGMFIFVATSVIIMNLVVDIVYALLDPRIRYEK